MCGPSAMRSMAISPVSVPFMATAWRDSRPVPRSLGPAIIARTGCELQRLDASHVQWELQADYLGQLCALLVLTVSPQRIILGGGVMSQECLFPRVRVRMLDWLGGYIDRDELLSQTDPYIVAPELGARAGVLGALALGLTAAGA
jgi:fructokinase